MFFDKRVLYFIIAVMVAWGLMSYLTNIESLLGLLFSIPGVLIAITFHEFAHAKVADMLGDDTPRYDGRLSLNPLVHIDPIGFTMLLFAGFGWGKPVKVNSRNYNRDITVEKADCLVSIAGPIINFIMAIILIFVYCFIYKFAGIQVAQNNIINIVMSMIYYAIAINIGLGVFNLIPLPPLDGAKVIKIFLPYNAKQWFENNERSFYIVFILLWITGLAGSIIRPISTGIFTGLFSLVNLIFKL